MLIKTNFLISLLLFFIIIVWVVFHGGLLSLTTIFTEGLLLLLWSDVRGEKKCKHN